MKLKYPKPTVDLAQIRREYHAAVEFGAKGRRQGMKAAPGSPRMASAT